MRQQTFVSVLSPTAFKISSSQCHFNCILSHLNGLFRRSRETEIQNFIDFRRGTECCCLSVINAVFFFPPCQQKCDLQDLHPDHLVLLLDASGGQEVFRMFHLGFSAFPHVPTGFIPLL